jgi:hypothetical protein
VLTGTFFSLSRFFFMWSICFVGTKVDENLLTLLFGSDDGQSPVAKATTKGRKKADAGAGKSGSLNRRQFCC